MGKSDQENEKSSKIICRDFLRNVCLRGDKYCKFLHPKDKQGSKPNSDIINFCHDFQNGRCLRNDCKFIHCTGDDEDYYNRTGELPLRVMEAPRHKWIVAELMIKKSGDPNIPLCKDYLNGECLRNKCKFQHLRDMSGIKMHKNSYTYDERHRENPECNSDKYFDDFDREYKRRKIAEENYLPDETPLSQPFPVQQQELPPNGHFHSNSQERIWLLEEENTMLRQRVAELKKRVDDLQATNEFLLEQNAQMRINDKGAASLTAVTVPAVTITNTVPAGAQLGAQMQPAQAPAPHQMAAIRTVTASVATVPVSLAAVAAGTPVSIATVSMAPVQIPPPVVTMAQPGGPPPQQNPSAGPQPLPMSISDPAAAPLVSYPIMTRPVLQTNLTH